MPRTRTLTLILIYQVDLFVSYFEGLFLSFFKKILVPVWLTQSVVLASGAPCSDSAILYVSWYSSRQVCF